MHLLRKPVFTWSCGTTSTMMEDSCYVSIPAEIGDRRSRGPTRSASRGVPLRSFPPARAHVSWPACGHADDPVTDARSSLLAPGPSHTIVRSHYSYFASSPRRMSFQKPASARGLHSKSARSSSAIRLHEPQAQLQSEEVSDEGHDDATQDVGPEAGFKYTGWQPPAEASAEADSEGTRGECRTAENLSLCQRATHAVVSLVKQTHLVVMGILIAVLDNMPYATLLFPASHAYLVSLGATAILTTTAASQIVMGLFSVFPFAVGAFTIENVPFLKSISVAAIQNAAAKGLNDDWVVSTILMCWMIASFLTAATFYTLGALKLGRVADYIPHTVLLGCIGGMGLFMVTAALGVAAGCEWEWNAETLTAVLSASAFPRICLTLVVEVVLILAEVKYSSPTFTPIFLLAFPAMFYVLLFLLGISVDTARQAGWIFGWAATPSDVEPATALETSTYSANAFAEVDDLRRSAWGKNAEPTHSSDQLTIYSQFSIGCVDWHCVFSQAPSMIAIVVFSVLHAPINVPSLTLTTGVPSTLDYELKVHGLASLAAAVTGGLQCYITYSTSTLFWKCGIKDHAASVLVGVGTVALLLTVSPSVILTYFPRPAAAVFMFHVGVVLVNDGLIASKNIVSFAEYVVILVTAASMQNAFTDGLIVGLILSATLRLFRTIVAAMRGRRWLS
ncbi:inorganic anion transporter, sulfate permease (SulP) family protein [Toxoplasma gondii RUB]|uniref:Inorganic anion transporter, sulfate permease (SulP) family protein n=1 Tax=Toxoplasma gondii RUB TaxID=935652 RepID=A0A086M2R2_TOXGO|nr:inorganic anion transporter, sulfate permease (SulP) family protein [Toxoplasma gondii RUB]